MNNNKSLFKSLRLALFIVLGFIIYAYGFQVTKVSLTEFRKESRIVSRERIMRSLARPDILEWEQEEFIANIPIYVPCKPDAPALPEVDTSGPYMVFDPPCGEPGSEIQIHGYNFPPNTSGPVSFLPGDDPANTLRLRTVHVRIDNAGEFHTAFELAERSNDETYNLIRATIRRNIGRPQFSTNALLTWDLIIETVFLALLATTLGTLLAMPISFLAARNIMKDVKSLLASISLSILGWPFGIFLGYQGAKYLSHFSASLSPTPLANLGSLIAALVLIWGLVRWAVPEQDEKLPQTSLRIARILAQSLAAACAIAAVQLLASLGISSGETIAASIGSYAFLAKFVATSADILGVIAPLLAALAGGAVIGNFASRFGQLLTERLPNAAIKTFNIISSGIAGASLFLIISSALGWLYEITDPMKIYWMPGALGAALGIGIALQAKPKEALRVGISIYYLIRTILNAIRSVEPLVMAIVAVIWVGIGPFAGTLALALHTIAALGKLYSEQVESILPGPLEAIQATGANRLQTIIYGVLPQIIPPYISFTMYRWDINVRMSTIIGFAGGGGVGFLLRQNLNLGNYNAASAQMVAIAIVVATMDYVSSTLRERVV